MNNMEYKTVYFKIKDFDDLVKVEKEHCVMYFQEEVDEEINRLALDGWTPISMSQPDHILYFRILFARERRPETNSISGK